MNDKRQQKEIKINGVRTIIILPEGVTPREFPKKIKTEEKKKKRLIERFREWFSEFIGSIILD